MSFWQTSTGENATKTTGAFESQGSFEPIPDNTTCLAVITKTSIDDYQGDEFVNIEWSVQKPDVYKNRKVFQKVRIFDADSKKRDKAVQMLAAIDKNAGGKLSKIDKAPDVFALEAALLNKAMLIKVMIWTMDDRKGNWVSAVSPRTSEQASKPAPAPAPEPQDDDDFDGIPF